jgi:hypothetical protein
MADEGWQALRALLGEAVPGGLDQLNDAQLQDLADAVKDARHRQAAALAQAGERALGHIPRLLRGPIRRVVG